MAAAAPSLLFLLLCGFEKGLWQRKHKNLAAVSDALAHTEWEEKQEGGRGRQQVPCL